MKKNVNVDAASDKPEYKIYQGGLQKHIHVYNRASEYTRNQTAMCFFFFVAFHSISLFSLKGGKTAAIFLLADEITKFEYSLLLLEMRKEQKRT